MNKLWVRMSLTFAGVVLVAVVTVVVAGSTLARLGEPGGPDHFTRRFLMQPNGLVTHLSNYYRTHRSWAGVEPLLLGAQSTYFRPDALFLANEQQRIIYSVQRNYVGRPLPELKPKMVLPIRVDGQTVGHVGLAPFPNDRPPTNGVPPFVRILGNALLVIAAVGGVGGILFGVLMSRTVTAPLNKLASAARSIGARNLNSRVEEQGTEEMVEVARAFNEMAADLQQAEALRRNLLADVAHELRNPLAILQGNLRAILDDVFPCDNNEMARLYEHTRFLSRLVNDLHELAQAEARQLPLELGETDLAHLIRTTADSFRPEFESKRVRLETKLAGDLPRLTVDQARLAQVLQNLLANALRHTPPGGTITVEARPEADTLYLTVADTGEGIAPEHLPHIFDRFYRTDPSRSRDRGGTGLGLAISRALIEAHGGEIRVASQGPDRGSFFTIQLPLTRKTILKTI